MRMEYITQYGIYNSPYVDWEGNPTEKTRHKYPYSYDPYVVYKKEEDYQHTVYSDRLFQWDWDKHNELCKKHFNNEGQYWNNRQPKEIENFLKDYFDDKSIELIGIMEGCNVGNGFPYWIFMYNTNN